MGRSQLQQFRFLHNEVAQMEKLWGETQGNPSRKDLMDLTIKLNNDHEQGKRNIQEKQVRNWFFYKRYILKKQAGKASGKSSAEEHISSNSEEASSATLSDEKEMKQIDFEARSSRDNAWYDVKSFLAHRMLDSGDPEVRVRFMGFDADEDEWVNVRSGVRPRSLPCEASECVRVIPGDLVLCFKEGSQQALYYDAQVIEVERRRHDIRGCRCRFLVRYEHDGSKDVVPLRKVCRRPETDFRPPPEQNLINSSMVKKDPDEP